MSDNQFTDNICLITCTCTKYYYNSLFMFALAMHQVLFSTSKTRCKTNNSNMYNSIAIGLGYSHLNTVFQVNFIVTFMIVKGNPAF